MIINKEYSTAIKQAKERVKDLKEREEQAIGSNALEFMDSLLTQEELEESNLRVALIGEIIKARHEKGLS